MEKRILIVEDEEKLARFLELELTHEGYATEKTGNGLDAVGIVSRAYRGETAPFDLVLLDVMLPGINGMEALRRILLLEGNKPPVIMLTARDQVMDKVAGLDAGATDYITKPFAIEELLARIRVALKLHGAGDTASQTANDQGVGEKDGVLRWRALTLDEKKRRVFWADDEVTLTNREFLMLKTLLENRDIVLSRDALLSKVCGYDYVGETNVIDVYVRYLRSKIDEAYGVKMISTVRGVGYAIYSDDEA